MHVACLIGKNFIAGVFGRQLGQNPKKFYRWLKSTGGSIQWLHMFELAGDKLNAAGTRARMPQPLQFEPFGIAGQLDVTLAFHGFALFSPGHSHRPFPIGNLGAARGAQFLISKQRRDIQH